jgi:DNA modification methylase
MQTFESNRIYIGHALDVLRQFPALSVDMVLTSPPYWNLRDYQSEPIVWGGKNDCEHEWYPWVRPSARGTRGRGGWDRPSRRANPTNDEMVSYECRYCKAWLGELGHEPTIQMYIDHLMTIFDVIWHVLTDYGTVFVVLGDTYYGTGAGQKQIGKHEYMPKKNMRGVTSKNKGTLNNELFKKSLTGIPWRFAIAMMDYGWILRNAVVWQKPNAIPQPDPTKFTPSYEFIFYFTKSLRRPYYWFNERTLEVIRKNPKGTKGKMNVDWEYITYYSKIKKREVTKKRSLWRGRDSYWEQRFEIAAESTMRMAESGMEGPRVGGNKFQGFSKISGRPYEFRDVRNMRDVWSFSTAQYKGAHFAVFPEDLIEIPMIAGCPETVCVKCGAPHQPVYEVVSVGRPELDESDPRYRPAQYYKKYAETQVYRTMKFKGVARCRCDAPTRKGIVLDPFFGAGTTGLVALNNNREFIGIEVNPDYAEQARKRLDLNQTRLSDFDETSG